jgi:hypothetical protein
MRRLLERYRHRADVELSSNLTRDRSGEVLLRLVSTGLAFRAASANPDTCDLRALEGSLQQPAGLWADALPALRVRWPGLARLVTAENASPDSLVATLRATRDQRVSQSDRDLASLAVDQWLRSRAASDEGLGAEWNRLGFRSVPYDGSAYTYCGSILPALAARAGEGDPWADEAFLVLLDLGWCSDCSESYEGAVFDNEIYRPVIKRGEAFLSAHPRSPAWSSVALRVALAHETAWCLGAEAPPDDFPDYRTPAPRHRARALELYRLLLPRTRDSRLARAIRNKIRLLEQRRDTKCQVYYLTGEC